VPIALTHENPEVRTALRGITGVDFGFDETAWHRWWTVDRFQKKLAPDLP